MSQLPKTLLFFLVAALAVWALSTTALAGPATNCGDGVIEGVELCDDGNTIDGDGCSSDCIPEICGDAILEANGIDPDEECDDGNTIDGDGCEGDCTCGPCGDGVLAPHCNEECDDGNLDNGDGCNSACQLEPSCGDGILDGNEECDDFNQTSGDGCSSTCLIEACGNGRIDFGEECDDSNQTGGDGCSSICVSEICGDGSIQPGIGEECDDGGTEDADGCSASCQLESCGDGELAPSESCDDGNTTSGDGCDENCTETACGNAIVTSGEECDDGNIEPGDGCGADCRIDVGAQTKNQQRCINEVNKRIATIGNAQNKASLGCLKNAAKGRRDKLGPAPATFDTCLFADVGGKVSKSQGKLFQQATRRCLVNDPPELAILEPEAGSTAATREMIFLVRDLFGTPADAIDAGNRDGARCQSLTLKVSNKLTQAIWRDLQKAKRDALAGKGQPPVRNNGELRDAIEIVFQTGKKTTRARTKLAAKIGSACGAVPGLGVVLAGCASDSVSDAVACADRSSLCRSCLVLNESDPLLGVDCDLIDDQLANESCMGEHDD